MQYPSVLEKRVCITCGSVGTIEYYDFSEYLNCPRYRCKKCGKITNELYVQSIKHIRCGADDNDKEG